MSNIAASPEVLDFFKSKSIKPSYNWKDVFEEEHATAFTVAKCTEIDVLATIKQEIETSITEGLSFKSFQKNITPKLQEMGWWGKKKMVDPKTGEEKLVQLGSPSRLQTIFDTNIRTANAAGKWQRIQRTKKLLPYLQYLPGAAARHRPQHEPYWYLVLPVDDAFWDSHYPPNGWKCKCFVRQIMKTEAENIGVSESPKLEYTEALNPRTGNIERKYKGVDLGFANNAGKTRMQTLANYTANKLPLIDANHAHIYYKQLMQNSQYKNGMLKDYQQWLQDVQKTKLTKSTKIAGVLNGDVLNHVGNKLHNGAIFIDGDVAINDVNLSENLVTDLLNPKAVLIDKSRKQLTVILPQNNTSDFTQLLIDLNVKSGLDNDNLQFTNKIISVKTTTKKDAKSSDLTLLSGSVN